MQLVASVFLWISPALVLTFIINQDWFWRYAPEWLRPYALSVPWESFIVGVLALIAAWNGGENFILRQVRALTRAVQRLADGDLQARSGLKAAEGEIGLLAQKFDAMAAVLQQRQKERDEAERKFLNRAMQQTAVAAVGQCALTNRDLSVIYEQAVYRVAEMFAVEYAMLFQRLPDGQLYPLAVYGLAPKIVGEGATRQNKPSQMSWTAETGEVALNGRLQYAVTPSHWVFTGTLGSFGVFRNPRARGWAWLATPGGGPAPAGSSVAAVAPGLGGGQTITVHATSTVTVQRSESWTTGWHATIRSIGAAGTGPAHPVDVHQNGVIQTVDIPRAGRYSVTFSYDPRSARAGLYLSGVGVAALVLWLAGEVAVAMRRRRTRLEHGPADPTTG